MSFNLTLQIDLPAARLEPLPLASLGQLRLVQPAHQPALTQEQRLIRAKQHSRGAAIENLLTRRAHVAGERRFTGESITGFGALA